MFLLFNFNTVFGFMSQSLTFIFQPVNEIRNQILSVVKRITNFALKSFSFFCSFMNNNCTITTFLTTEL